MKQTRFFSQIVADKYLGSDTTTYTILIAIEDRPGEENNAFEHLTVQDVEKLRDLCNEVLETLK